MQDESRCKVKKQTGNGSGIRTIRFFCRFLLIFLKVDLKNEEKRVYYYFLETAKTNNSDKGDTAMAMPKRKVSKMKRRQRQAHNRYKGVQATFCTNCGEPAAPHTVCKHCGTYKGKQVLTAE